MTTETRRFPGDEIVAAPRPAPRWWLIPALALATLLLLVVLTVVIFALGLRQQHHAALAAVQDQVARAQAAGEPVTVEDLYAFHRVPPGTRDITEYWLTALNSFNEQQFNADAQFLPIVGEGDKATLRPVAAASQLAAAEVFLQKYDDTLQATLTAARQEGECRFPVQFEKGIEVLLPHAQRMRSLARLLALSERARAFRGDTDGAVESLEAMFAASNALEHEPFLVEHLVRLATLSMAFEEIQWLLNEMQLTDAQLDRLQSMLQALDLKGGLTTGLLGERAMDYYIFHHLPSLANEQVAPGAGLPRIMLGIDGQLGLPADCLKSLELFGEAITASREPFPEARQRVGQVENRLKSIVGSRNPLDKLNHIVTALLMPAIVQPFDATARGMSREGALGAAVAAERYRLKTGEFPAKLADLVPEFLSAVPTDPFDGQPLRLIARQEELVIYSIGKDGKDDGGREGSTPGEPDIVVRVRAEKAFTP